MPRRDFSLQQLRRDNAWLISHLRQSGAYVEGLIPEDIRKRAILNLDLSTNNPEILAAKTQTDFLGWIRRQLSSSEALIGVSAHAEKRMHFGLDKEMTHLGLDVFSVEDFPVLSPINGTLYSVQGDGTGREAKIVLQHRLGTLKFYTVFNHLISELMLIPGSRPGELIRAGEPLGFSSSALCHHAGLSQFNFMIVLEAKEEPFEVPEYIETRYENYFLALCPDPTALLGRPEPTSRQLRSVEPLRINPATNRPYRSLRAQGLCKVVSNMRRFY